MKMCIRYRATCGLYPEGVLCNSVDKLFKQISRWLAENQNNIQIKKVYECC